MGYVNLSIYVGKISKKISGKKNFYGPVQGPSKLKSENSGTSKSGNLYFALQRSKMMLSYFPTVS